ncbi:hypothetical protein B0H66DRAFT_578122 [Apodospora peruviana]|uniref:Secreted protein n=1 Tax=Apodospora peruviana TaxID=516989 RepID=A0AAE0HTX0_9PEZI|nr:hypothetical protein B0H66DRAFT_578122 [Apodospora peruviana]
MSPVTILPIFAGLAAGLPTEVDANRRAASSSPDEVRVASIAYAGSGCSASTITGPFSSDGKTFGLPHGSLVAQSGPGTSPAYNRRNCQIALKIRYSSGWQFSVTEAEYTGSAQLPGGVSGSSNAIIYFGGETNQATSTKTIGGPFDGKYVHVAKFVGANAVWSPCGSESILNINADAHLDPDNVRDTARFTVDTPPVVDVQWRRC